MLSGINHITLAVTDLNKSLEFYIEVLGFTGHVKWDQGAYLTIGDLWLCLASDTPCKKDDYTHFAFSISPTDNDLFCEQLALQGVKQWKRNHSEKASLSTYWILTATSWKFTSATLTLALKN